MHAQRLVQLLLAWVALTSGKNRVWCSSHRRSFSSDALTSALLPLQAIEEDYARSEGNLNHAKDKPDPDMQLESKLACRFALAYVT